MKALELIKPYFLENRMVIVLGFACLILVDFLQLTIPRIIKWAIDDLTSFTATPSSLAVYTGYILVIGLMIGFFRYLWRRFLLGTSRRVEEGLRNRLFTHTQALSASYYDKTRTGDLMAHATNDIQQVRMATGMGLVAINDAVVLGAAAIGFMAWINLRLTFCTDSHAVHCSGNTIFQQKDAPPLSGGAGIVFRSHRGGEGAVCRHPYHQGLQQRRRRSTPVGKNFAKVCERKPQTG